MGGRVDARVTMPDRDPVEDAIERAAIMEFGGGLSRDRAEIDAARTHGVTVEQIRRAVALRSSPAEPQRSSGG